MLRICPVEGQHIATSSNFLTLDERKKQVTVYDPSMYSGYTTPSLRRPMAPKMFAFDAVFDQDDSLVSIVMCNRCHYIDLCRLTLALEHRSGLAAVS